MEHFEMMQIERLHIHLGTQSQHATRARTSTRADATTAGVDWLRGGCCLSFAGPSANRMGMQASRSIDASSIYILVDPLCLDM